MDNITLSLEFFAGLLGKPATEFSAALMAEDGKELKPANEVEAHIRTVYADKIGDIKKGESGKAERLAKKEVEDFISQNFGISSGNVTERLAALKTKFEAKPPAKSKDITPEMVRNSEVYKLDLKKATDALQVEKTAHVDTKKGYAERKLSEGLTGFVGDLLSDAKNKFVIPQGGTDEETKRIRAGWTKVIADQLKAHPKAKISTNDAGDLQVLNRENDEPYLDEAFNPVTLGALGMQVARQYIPVAAAASKSTPGAGSAEKMKEEATKTAEVPTFKSLVDAGEWIEASTGNPDVTPEMLSAVKAQLPNLPETVEA